MDMKTRLQQELKAAMRNKDERRKRTLRMVLSAIKLAEVEKGCPLRDEEVWSVIRKEIKARQETAELARQGGREDIAREAEAEIQILEVLLPPPLTDEELDAIIDQVLQETGASSMKDMGRVMKAVMERVRGRAEGARVSQRVRAKLAA